MAAVRSPAAVKESPPMAEQEASTGGESGGSTRADDQALLAALRRGDEDAFKRLVDEHGPFLMRLALMHVPSRAIAEEVVQDTWLAVLNGIDRFEGRSALRTWIASILLNTARTRGQRERRVLPFSFLGRRRREEGRDEPAVDPDRFQSARDSNPGAWARPPVEWASPEERLGTEEARRVLLEAIAELPARQREVIALRDISGWSAEETRNALGLSATNQRVLLHRARSKVRQALERYFSEEERVG
jgi:RNA polymerase sigma-70 factor (ECF subfamily)